MLVEQKEKESFQEFLKDCEVNGVYEYELRPDENHRSVSSSIVNAGKVLGMKLTLLHKAPRNTVRFLVASVSEKSDAIQESR